MICDMSADTDGVSITARGEREDIGKVFEVSDCSGRKWLGVVDDDCIALLVRSDIMQRKCGFIGD